MAMRRTAVAAVAVLTLLTTWGGAHDATAAAAPKTAQAAEACGVLAPGASTAAEKAVGAVSYTHL